MCIAQQVPGAAAARDPDVLLGCRVVLKVREAVEADGLVHERRRHRLLDEWHRRRREVNAVFGNCGATSFRGFGMLVETVDKG